MDIELPNDFKEFLKLLNSHQVEYLLIGGCAVGYHSYPRATAQLKDRMTRLRLARRLDKYALTPLSKPRSVRNQVDSAIGQKVVNSCSRPPSSPLPLGHTLGATLHLGRPTSGRLC